MLRTLMLVLSLASATSFARPLTTEQKLEDFQTLVNTIQVGYGPLEYKMLNKGIDLKLLNSLVEARIRNTSSNAEFYYELVKYVSAYHDGHFSIRLPSTLAYTVAVTTDLIGGKVLITGINRDLRPVSEFPFEIGDEIISVDGVEIQKWLDEQELYVGNGTPRATRRVAAWTVFLRRANRVPVPQTDTLKIEVRRGTSDIVESASLKWHIEGEGLDQSRAAAARMTPFRVMGRNAHNFDRLVNETVHEYRHPEVDRGYSCSGDTRVSIPADATVIMKKPFVAYYHPTPKGNVGYLRIPHYYPQTGPAQNPTEVTLNWIAQYEYAIQLLEQNTVGLIIDQDHNCGGSVWIVNKTISMFMDQAFKPSDFELLASKESYLALGKWMENVPQNSLEYQGMLKVRNLVKDTWLNGTSRLTVKTPLDGQALFSPNFVRYTKPVVILIDEMAGSGGDMFPSMMQGLGRAKLFGQTTSGLGGHIMQYPAPLPNSQMQYTLTKSLFYRPDGVAIENNGAVPDQTYAITRDDILYGFKDYQKAYLDYLSSLLP